MTHIPSHDAFRIIFAVKSAIKEIIANKAKCEEQWFLS